MDVQSTPQEIVCMVLKNFILERTQLLNARLVCRSWNTEALIQLKNSKFEMTLSSKRIRKFIKFAQGSPNFMQQFILPFALKFNVRETEETKIHLELERMNSSLESLLNIFEPECIISLSLRVSPTTVEQMSEVIKILARVSPTIGTLKLITFKLGQSINVDIVNTLFTNREFSFPKLKSLALSSLQLCHLAQYPFCSHLTSKASALMEELTLPTDLGNNEFKISIEMLKQLKSISVQDLLFVDLVGNNLLSSALTKLHVRATYFAHHPRYHRFMESLFSFANSLEDLNIEFIGEKPFNLPPFSEFQSLKQLQITTCWNGNVIPEFVNSMVFPILTFIDMHLDICRLLTNINECVTGPDQEMSKVKQVTLRLKNQGPETVVFNRIIPPKLPVANPHPFHTYFEYLIARFPNAQKIIIINESFDENYFKPFLRCLIGSEGAKNFYELEFVNFDENYLGQIFEETQHTSRIILENVPRSPEFEKMITQIFQNLVPGSYVRARIETEENQRRIIQTLPNQDTSNQLINLKSLTLRLDWKAKSKCSKRRVKRLTNLGCITEEINKFFEEIANSLNLLSLARNLPSLEEINISPIMFGSYDKTIQAKEIHSVIKEYPDMKIITI